MGPKTPNRSGIGRSGEALADAYSASAAEAQYHRFVTYISVPSCQGLCTRALRMHLR